jgi:hypothetical protein
VITMPKWRRPTANDREASSTDQGRSTFERGLFAIMGPPQLGEDKPREGYVPDAAADLCHKCDRPWDAHGRVHATNMTYRPCPAPQGG